MVRKFDPVSGNWSTVDQVADGGPYDIAVGPDDSIYVVGVAGDDDDRGWLVRKSSDSGKTWHDVDRFEPSKGMAFPDDIFVDRAGTVFIAGWVQIPRGEDLWHSFWLVRSSTDGGQTWSTVDTYEKSIYSTYAGVLGQLPDGTLLAAGTREVDEATDEWMIRRSNDGGKSWSAVSQAVPISGMNFLKDLVVGPLGEIYLIGYGAYSAAGGPADLGSPGWLVMRAGKLGEPFRPVGNRPCSTDSAPSAGIATPHGLLVVGQCDSGIGRAWLHQLYPLR